MNFIEKRKLKKELKAKEKSDKRKKNFDEIFEKITSEDIERLDHTLALTNELLNDEEKRGNSAEKRINSFFPIWGVISGLFVLFGKFFPLTNGNFTTLINFFILGILVLIIKIGYNFWASIRVRNSYIIWPSTIYEVQKGNKTYALRYEIARKIHNYFDRRDVNSDKLSCLEDMQNNLILVVVYFLLLGGCIILNSNNTIKIPQNYLILIGLISIILALIFDNSYRKLFRKFWH